jgi:hypothetical protein
MNNEFQEILKELEQGKISADAAESKIIVQIGILFGGVLLNKIGPEGLYDIANGLMRIADEDVQSAINLDVS